MSLLGATTFTEAVVVEPLLRAQAVAELLSLRPATVYKLCHLGVLPHVRLTDGARRPIIRFRLTEVAAWLRERQRGGGEGAE